MNIQANNLPPPNLPLASSSQLKSYYDPIKRTQVMGSCAERTSCDIFYYIFSAKFSALQLSAISLDNTFLFKAVLCAPQVNSTSAPILCCPYLCFLLVSCCSEGIFRILFRTKQTHSSIISKNLMGEPVAAFQAVSPY